MYPVTEEIENHFQFGGRQLTRITFRNGQTTLHLTESDIIQGGLTIDRYSMTGNKIELGSGISSELTLKLRNYEGTFDEVNFEGAELFVEIGVKDWSNPDSAVTYIPCGYFIIDEPPRTLATISISALDRMCKFAHWVDMNLLAFPITIENLVKAVCQICGVTLKTDLTAFPNYNWVVESTFTGEGVTYQSIIQWCAYVLGACAYVDYDGELVFAWYQNTGFEISPSNRYNSDLLENDIQITGLLYTNEQNQEYLFGTKDYAIENQCNILLQNNISEALTPIWNVVQNFRYRPFTANIKPAPFLYPLDGVIFVDKNGNRVNSCITHITYTLNGACTVSAQGETAKREEMKVTRLTPQQIAMIRQMESAIPSVTSQLITAALTGYVIIRPDEILVMDTDDPKTATSVWRWNRGGLGYSHSDVAGEAYDGVYSLAIGMNGEIVADFIRAGTMFADRIRGGTLVLGGEGTSGGTTSGAMSVLDEDGNEIARVDKNGVYTENFDDGNWLLLANGALTGGISGGQQTTLIDATAYITDLDHGITYRGLGVEADAIDFRCELFGMNGATGTTGYLNYVGDVSFTTTQVEVVTDAYIDGNGVLQLTKSTIEFVSGWSWYKTGTYFRNGIMCTALESWATGGATEHSSGVSVETGGTGGSHVYPPEPEPEKGKLSGVPPLAFYTTGTSLTNYTISGASGGVGDLVSGTSKYRITVAILNKNLWGYRVTADEYGFLDDTGAITHQSPENYVSCGFIPIPSGISQLTFSFMPSGYPYARIITVCAYDANKNFISAPIFEGSVVPYGTRCSRTFTVPAGTAFLRTTTVTREKNASMVSSDYEMQLEVGDTMTTYALSVAQKYYITLDAPLYGGETYTFDGTVAIGTNANSWNFLFIETAVQPEKVTIWFDVEE